MFQMVTVVVKWISLPALLVASLFSRYAASYELQVDLVVCLGALIFALRAIQLREYFWAAGLVTIAVVFSPLVLIVKIFLLMGLACVATSVTLVAAFRKKPLLAWLRRRTKKRVESLEPAQSDGFPVPQSSLLKAHPTSLRLNS
jgi:hypothetical protein